MASAHLAVSSKIIMLKNSALVYQTGALFFVFKKCYNKGYNSTKHNYKREQIRVCNHQHQPLTKEQEEILEKYGSYPPLETLAAHFDGDEYTDEELKEIRRFAKYIKSLRQIERNNLDKSENN